MNYIIEDNIDFNQILMKALCTNDTDTTDDTVDKCLISNNPLNNEYITLKCNHKFNYSNIFQEIYRQKKKTNVLEIQNLAYNELKCPYCRNIQKGILPYNSEFPKVKNVNWPPSKAYHGPNNCHYQIKSGKRKGENCNTSCMNHYCRKHSNPIYQKLRRTLKICKGIIKSGKRKGQTCKYTVKNSQKTGDFCKIHALKKDNK